MINGSITALVTPFKDGSVDETAFQDFIEWQITSGIHGLVVPVIAGAGSNETRMSIAYAQKAKDVGADAALVVTPYYNKPSQEGIYQHFKAIAEAVDIPIIVYNIPGALGSRLRFAAKRLKTLSKARCIWRVLNSSYGR